jgi:hypothetical protein
MINQKKIPICDQVKLECDAPLKKMPGKIVQK